MNIACREIKFTGHALRKMFAKNISANDVRHILENGEVIKSYDDDRPYPSFLLLGFINAVPLHVVVAENKEEQTCIIVTAYKPKANLWSLDFKTKKK